MRQVFFTDGQYLNAAALNPVAVDAASGIQQGNWAWAIPGLIRPDVLSWATSGLVVSVTAPLPFQVQFGSGVIAAALGVQNGAQSNSYSINVSGLVPGTGSNEVYVLANYLQIDQTAVSIVGPPPGNPAFNPAFTPVTAYTELVDSLAISASLTAANNLTTFELARFNLRASATGISLAVLDYSNQQVSSTIYSVPSNSVSGNITLTRANAGVVNIFSGSGLTATLPTANPSAGYPFYFSGIELTSGYSTVACQGSDLIYGIGGGGQTWGQISIPPGGFVGLRGEAGNWQVFEESGIEPIVFQASGTPLTPISISTSGGLQIPYNATVSGTVTCSGATATGQAVILGQFPSNIADNGYKRYPDSNSPTGYLIEQWGQGATAGSSLTSFPVAFNHVLNLTLTYEAVAYPLVILGVNYNSVSGFQIFATALSGSVGTALFYWRALGY